MVDENIKPVLLICHICNDRAKVKTVNQHARFMDRHKECAKKGWGTSPELK